MLQDEERRQAANQVQRGGFQKTVMKTSNFSDGLAPPFHVNREYLRESLGWIRGLQLTLPPIF